MLILSQSLKIHGKLPQDQGSYVPMIDICVDTPENTSLTWDTERSGIAFIATQDIKIGEKLTFGQANDEASNSDDFFKYGQLSQPLIDEKNSFSLKLSLKNDDFQLKSKLGLLSLENAD